MIKITKVLQRRSGKAKSFGILYTMEDCAENRFQHDSEEMHDILRQISDLVKWREIFDDRGMELRNCITKTLSERAALEGDGEDAAGRHTYCTQRHCTLHSLPCLVPQTLAASPSLGGVPASPEQIMDLRKILFGNTFHFFNYEWKKSVFRFRDPCSELSYALQAERGGPGAVQMVVQANVIKFLLFTCQSQSNSNQLHSLGDKEQEQALASALSDVLWVAGEEQAATVTLVTSMPSFFTLPGHQLDSITERLHIFSFIRKEDMWKFIYEHIQCFQEEGSHGVILFLYSLVFSRTIDRLKDDLDSTTSHLLHLSQGNFVCHQALLNLLLTGRASPNVFNGTVQFDEAGAPLLQPLRGVLVRSNVGYLNWSWEQGPQTPLPQVGSMLKTPKLPVWVCCINGTYSILFSLNRALLSNWRTEHLFELHFYNGQPSQKRTAVLTIDTHSQHWEPRTTDAQGDLEKKFPSVDMTIRTKWEGAVINWNGVVPFF
ncbi:inactive ubiquitin carboxyl-terminal hydrolase MINDY-4B [Paramormyrops kingsleyae]|uniref:inactive ubiquitin carboxyl-terminal hydrolase MINDY-4B n=1 Tax=Paramormyrops kingsleyae TaxID=1676925 RepID=UPI003B974911